MKLPPPMHYAVKMALEDGLSALDAGRLRSGDIPSGVVMSLKNRRDDLKAHLARWNGYSDASEVRRELVNICVLLGALDASPLVEGDTP